MSENLAELQQRLGYQFQDSALLRRALTHRSVAKQHNERFEFLGDSLLGFLVADFLYRQFPEASEGELTRSRATLVNKPALADLARRWGLGGSLRLGSGERKSGGAQRDSILADAVEAVIAAVYLDAGLDQCQRWLTGCLQQGLAADQAGDAEQEPKNSPSGQRKAIASISEKDAKTKLQEWLQARSLELPAYQIVEVSGPAHEQRFVVSCQVTGANGVLQSKPGEGRSKRAAEQAAAAIMLAHLMRGESVE